MKAECCSAPKPAGIAHCEKSLLRLRNGMHDDWIVIEGLVDTADSILECVLAQPPEVEFANRTQISTALLHVAHLIDQASECGEELLSKAVEIAAKLQPGAEREHLMRELQTYGANVAMDLKASRAVVQLASTLFVANSQAEMPAGLWRSMRHARAKLAEAENEADCLRETAMVRTGPYSSATQVH